MCSSDLGAFGKGGNRSGPGDNNGRGGYGGKNGNGSGTQLSDWSYYSPSGAQGGHARAIAEHEYRVFEMIESTDYTLHEKLEKELQALDKADTDDAIERVRMRLEAEADEYVRRRKMAEKLALEAASGGDMLGVLVTPLAEKQCKIGRAHV